MAELWLDSRITIGKLVFSGVHDVVVDRSLHNYTDTAKIKVPSVAFISKGRRAMPVQMTTGNLFTDGDPVKIELGYNGKLQTEFEGFVKRRNLNMPLEVECEGYVRQLRLKSLSVNLSKGISVKKLLQTICAGTDIKVEVPVDFTLYGRNLINASGTQILDEIMKCSDNTLAVFFKEPQLLFCGLVYTSYIAGSKVFDQPQVKYRLGWNTPKENGLKERIPVERVQVFINGKLATGDAVRTQSDDKAAARKVQSLMNNVHDVGMLKQFANEKANHMNYAGYEGKLTAFLTPFALPGYTAYVADARYPERDGEYIIESTSVRYGLDGARRIVELGPRVGSI
jgi:hypothetical protein